MFSPGEKTTAGGVPRSIIGAHGGCTMQGTPVRRTHILVRNDLHAEHVACGFKDLLQDVLSHPWIQSTHVESSLVRFGGGSAHIASSACRRHHIASGHGGHGGRYRIGILGNDHRGTRGRGHVRWGALAVALSSIVLLIDSRRLWQRSSRCLSVFSHCDFLEKSKIFQRRSEEANEAGGRD